MRKKRVLVVEDNELNRELLCQILSQEYDVIEAENGQVALEILKEHKNSISLIFLDASRVLLTWKKRSEMQRRLCNSIFSAWKRTANPSLPHRLSPH